MTANMNDRSEIEFASVENPLNMHSIAPITLASKIPNCIIN